MATSRSSERPYDDSPDPPSHTANFYDATGPEAVWLHETEDDDDTFEPTTDESEDAEFFDPSEDVEADFHGMVLSKTHVYTELFPSRFKQRLSANIQLSDIQMLRMA